MTLDADKQKVAAWVKEMYDAAKNQRQKPQLTWQMNMAFYFGNQYMTIVPKTNRLTTPTAPPYRVRHIINRIRPIIRTEYSRLTSQKPSATVIPASSEDEDLFAAYAAEQVWESVSNRAKMATHFNKSVFWKLLTGTSFVKTYWDINARDTDAGVVGDIKYGCVTPFNLLIPDQREEDIQEQSWVINAYTKPLPWVQRYYGKALEGINVVPDVVSASEIMNDSVLNLQGTTPQQPDQVLCIEMWAKAGAHELIDQDCVIHVVAGNVVQVGRFYQHGLYPFTRFIHIPTGKFYGESVIQDLIPLQREYNRTRSQITENANRMGRPQLLVAKGSIEPSKVTNEPGQMITYRPGLPEPKPLPLQPLPAYIENSLDRTLQDMEDISGQHEVSRGDAPPGVTAATAISYLQEKDDSLMSHTFQCIETGMEEIAKMTLNLAQEFWDTERMVKVVGDDGYFDTLMLKGSQLKGNTDIRMEGGSSLPTSKAAKQALLMDLMKMGFVDPNEGLKIMDIGGVQKLWQRLKRDEQQAQRENIRMKSSTPEQIEAFISNWQQQQEAELMQQSQQQMDPMANAMDPMAAADPMMQEVPDQDPLNPLQTIDAATGMPLHMPPLVPVNSWDNHEVHIEVHNNFRKTQAFELLSPVIKAQFEHHVNMHMLAIQDAMQQVEMMTGGGMGEPGPGEEAGMPGDGPNAEMPPGPNPNGEQGPPPPPGM